MPPTAFFSRLAPVFGRRPGQPRSWFMVAIHALAILLTVIYFLFALLILVLRLGVLPQIEGYRPDIEQALGEALHRDVKIRHIDAYWVGWHPALTLHGLEIKDLEGRAALELDTVEAELAWDSLLTMQMSLARLEIFGPSMVIRRDPAGKISVAGVGVDQVAGNLTDEQTRQLVLATRRQNEPASEGDAASDWLLAQHRILIRDASITWIDESRGAPPLEL